VECTIARFFEDSRLGCLGKPCILQYFLQADFSSNERQAGYVFSAEGATFIAAWGSGPGNASAESAIHSGAISVHQEKYRELPEQRRR